MRIWQKILLILLLPLIFEIAFVTVLVLLLSDEEKTAAQFKESKKVLIAIDKAENATLESVFSLAPNRGDTAKPVNNQFVDLRNSMDTCKRAVDEAANTVRPELKSVLKEVPEVFAHANRLIMRSEKIYRDPEIPPLKRPRYLRQEFFLLVFELKPVLSEMHRVGENMRALEPVELGGKRLLIALTAASGLLASLVISLALSRLLLGDIVNRLKVIQENAFRVAAGQALLPNVSGKDEISELDSAFHRAAQMMDTARKKEFAILEKSSDVLFSLDSRLRIANIGKAAMRAWGLNPSDLIGTSFLALLTADSADKALSALESTGQMSAEQNFECQINGGDKVKRDFLCTASWDSANKLFHCIAHDITERRRLEKEKQELMATASHRINQPLDSVNIGLLKVSECKTFHEDKNLSKMLVRARGNLERLSHLIQDLLDMEQMEAGKMSLNLDDISAEAMCRSAKDAVNALAVSSGITLVFEGRDAIVKADRRRIEQVLINLLSNAIKYSPRGGTVTLSIDAQNNMAELSVIDQGPGIEEADQALVFDKFFQTKTKPTTEVKSTGLGLSICKIIVEAHQGKIGLESAPSKGSRFFVQLAVSTPGKMKGESVG